MEEELKRELGKRGLSYSNVPDKGRCLFSTRDFSPGEVIISQEPYVSVPNKTSGNSRCDWCFSSSNLKRCSSCQVVWYCGSTCQKSDWKLHQLECQALSKLDKNRIKSLTPSIRLMVKLFIRKKLQREKIIPTTSMDNYKLVEALVSHMSEVDEKQLLLYAQMANLVNVILRWPDVSIKEIAENFAKLAANAHTICDSELRPLGTGLYPVISIINHSCLPNSVLVFEGKMAVVRAVQPVPRGSEVLISYIETAGSTLTRQKTLKEQYYFTCTCSRCSNLGQPNDIEESSVLEGYRCKDANCNGFLLCDSDNKGFICQQCGLLRDREDLKKILGELKLTTEKASMNYSSGNRAEASALYKMIEKLQLKLCHPFSLNLMRTRETILKISMELQDWGEALAYCKLTIPVYERVYPGHHPLLGLQYYTCGKLDWLHGNTEGSIKSLTKAVKILRNTHGERSPFTEELLSKLEEAHAEASYKLSSSDY
ncbi:histone-lysine N-methyltransferase ASHR1 [Heracleum sosnowskyi]|uniref:Histone-lysine N-methyltransferase ASHR1 n=1 Tax=Heracleum sosnowskyi TaxID=360622 RepID=A0AAD8IHB1_9APIA|nr:histone-lysine N-methyltransferase ASHR1 [Heracleum sosnowskyi]